MGGVAIEHRRVARTNLARVVEDDDLGVEAGSLLGGIILRVGGDVATTNVLDGDVPERMLVLT